MKKKKLKKRINRLDDAINRIRSKIEESPTPSCETCKYKGFAVLGADSPCFGCVVTEGNFKMYEPKEN